MALNRYGNVWFLLLAVMQVSGDPTSYEVYTMFENAVIGGNTDSTPNLAVIADFFFPKGRIEPICVPVNYSISSTDHSHSFLWTEGYLPSVTAILLLSYSQSGTSLKGFQWESSCLFANQNELVLEVDTHNYSNDTIKAAFQDLTTQLKAISEANGTPTASSSYRGYALDWNDSKKQLDRYGIVFIVHIVILNIFIFTSALSSSDFLYQKLYTNIKGKTNPGYSFYWAIVFLSVVWNVAPSWLVLSKHDNKVYISLGILIPLQFFVALIVRKRKDFPIPGSWFKNNHTARCVDNIHSMNHVLIKCYRCALSHVVQVFSIWSLLITFTFGMHYLTPIIVSLYLDPLNSIVKIAFVKAVIVCLIISLALLFAVDTVSKDHTRSQNANAIVSVLTVLSIVPILCFVVFMIGSVIFNESPENSTWKTAFTILPSALLLYGSWYGHGVLFPKGVSDTGNPVKVIEDGLEGDHTQPPPTATESVNAAAHEATPLLPHPRDEALTTSIHSGSFHADDKPTDV